MLNIRVELFECKVEQVKSKLYGNANYSQDFWWDLKSSYISTGKFGTLVQTDFDQEYGKYVFLILDDKGKFQTVSNTDMFRARVPRGR